MSVTKNKHNATPKRDDFFGADGGSLTTCSTFMDMDLLIWDTHTQTYLDVGCTPVLLDKDPEEELSLLARLEGGGDDAVAALGQPQPLAHLAQVDERVGSVHLVET